MAIPMKSPQNSPSIEDLLIKGDLASLSAEQRTEYYMRVCTSIGLNPMTQPFSYLVLNGKLTLYANRACADQLRKINGISIEIVSQEIKDGLMTVHVRAKDAKGRTDEDLGVVSFGAAKGEMAANMVLKAITKAKRRVTLSISGLGYLDETEVEDIPSHAKLVLPPHDPKTGEIKEDKSIETSPRPTPQPTDDTVAKAAGAPGTDAPAELTDAMQLADDTLAKAAKNGTATLKTAWLNLEKDEKAALMHRMDDHKKVAELADSMAGG